jgi:hypothetical protein
MVSSELKDRVVWMIVDGPLLADEFIRETDKWISRPDEYDGYITDVRKMTTASAVDKKRIEERRQQNKTGKASAILVRDDFMGTLAKIYIDFTKASDTKIFQDPEKAAIWIRAHRKADGAAAE